jgi:hypothetical protein
MNRKPIASSTSSESTTSTPLSTTSFGPLDCVAAHPEAQRISRREALRLDFCRWRADMMRHHGRDVGELDLYDAIAQVVGPTAKVPSFEHFRKCIQPHGDRELSASLERAFYMVTGGEELRKHHQQAVYGEIDKRRQRMTLMGAEAVAA